MTLNRKIPSETKMFTNSYLSDFKCNIIKNQPDFSETNFWKVKNKIVILRTNGWVMVESGLS